MLFFLATGRARLLLCGRSTSYFARQTYGQPKKRRTDTKRGEPRIDLFGAAELLVCRMIGLLGRRETSVTALSNRATQQPSTPASSARARRSAAGAAGARRSRAEGARILPRDARP